MQTQLSLAFISKFASILPTLAGTGIGIFVQAHPLTGDWGQNHPGLVGNAGMSCVEIVILVFHLSLCLFLT